MTWPLKIAALQMLSTPDVDRNLAAATRLMEAAAADGVRLVALPEYFCLLGRTDRDKLAIAEALDDGPIQAHLAAAARRRACGWSAARCRSGAAHWALLLRARAVEDQCYVLAPAQGGLHENGRRTWGHSLLADPRGEMLACQPEGEAVVAGTLDRDRLAAVRRQLPALAHRRL